VHLPSTYRTSLFVQMPGEQRQRSYRLTDAAVAGFDRMATRHHVTVTALLEALGVIGADHDPSIDEVVSLARRLDRERRSRH
jgi:hypothetical protein